MAGLARDALVDGRYRILSRIGSGGMADVYCAQDTQLGRRVALKLLHERFAQDTAFVERFRREASAAAGLAHPNVVAVYDRGEWDGTSYIAMEHLPGRTLAQLVREHGPLDPALAVDLTVQVLRAAGFAHRHGIVHRDLTAHNVIVDDEGRAKVTDFGIARAGASDMTEAGALLGTARYVSPEQAQGRPVDARSDLYSVGIVLYELLCGTVPFGGDSAVALALKHVSEPPVPPSRRNPAVPPALDAVVLRALAKDPAARFPDAEPFIAALRAAVAGGPSPVVVVAEDPVAVVEEDDRRGRGRIVALALGLLAVAGIALAAWLLTRPQEVRVPRVVGERSAAAARKLKQAGFEVDVVPVRSAKVAQDRVVRQRPAGRRRAPEGSTVTLEVSSGPGEAAVPAVQGLSAEAAAARLRRAGFRSTQRQVYSDAVASGRVVRSTPAAGTTVRRGTGVALDVSRGPRLVAVPGVLGEPRATAEAALRDAGFAVRVRQRESTAEAPGTVLEQAPGGGAAVAPGVTVTLVVARAPAAVVVPGVVDAPEADARDALEAAGFAVTVQDVPVETPGEDGLVTAQDPAAGAKRPRGETVTITVGRFALPPPDPETTVDPG